MFKKIKREVNGVINFIEEILLISGTFILFFGVFNEIIMFMAHPEQFFTTSDKFVGMEVVEPLMARTAIYSLCIGISLIILGLIIILIQKKVERKKKNKRCRI